MVSDTATGRPVDLRLRENWGWFVALGLVFLLAGLFALAMPLASSIAVTVIIAFALAFAGVVQIFQAFRTRSWGGFALQLIIGLIILIGAVFIYFDPLAGTFALTLLVASVFLAKGLVQIVLALRVRPHRAWGWILFAGIVAILVGLMILIDFPVSGVYALGVLAGVSLIMTGWSYIALAFASRA